MAGTEALRRYNFTFQQTLSKNAWLLKAIPIFATGPRVSKRASVVP